jgi:hypothetical protein
MPLAWGERGWLRQSPLAPYGPRDTVPNMVARCYAFAVVTRI